MQKVGTFVWRWCPALVLMAAIFFASSQAKATVPQFGSYDWPVKKVGHLISYGLLGIAYLHGLAAGGRPTVRLAIAAVLMAAAYGTTDEFHQSFVEGRGAGPVDVAIDTLGAMGGLAAEQAIRALIGRRLTRTPTPPVQPRPTP